MRRALSLLLVTLPLASACGENDPATPSMTVADHLVSLGPITSNGLPPGLSFCGRVQPGYDPGPPPTLRGEPYSTREDTFCTITMTRHHTFEDGEYKVRNDVFVARTGEAAPGADVQPWMKDETLFCGFETRLTVEPALGISDDETLVQLHALEIERVTGAQNCVDNFPAGSVLSRFYTFRTTDSDYVMYLTESDIDGLQGGSHRYMGTVGTTDTGGHDWLDPNTVGGAYEAWHACDPITTVGGHEMCRPRCRYFDPANGLEQCGWEHFPVLPADRELIEPDWAAQNPDLVEQAFAGR